MTTRTFAAIMAVCLVASAGLLVLSALTGSGEIGVAGLVPLLVLGLARWWWST